METSSDGTWTCPRCGEWIEPEFDSCWQCGTAREGGSVMDPGLFVQMVVDNQPVLQPPLPSTEGLETPCPICGGADYAWGNVENAIFVGVTDYRAGFRLAARVCRQCSNVQTFVKWPT